MKTRFLTSIIAAVAAFMAVSCSNNNSTVIYISFATANVRSSSDYDFTTDGGSRLYPEVDRIKYKYVDGERYVIFFSETGNSKTGYDKCIDLRGINSDIDKGATATVNNKEELDALGTEGTSIELSPRGPNTSGKYVNLFIGFTATEAGLSQHKFTLAYNTQDADQGSILDMHLCHNPGTDVDGVVLYWGWVSFPMDNFTQLFATKETIRIAIQTRLEGIQYVTVPVPSINGETKSVFGSSNRIHE